MSISPLQSILIIAVCALVTWGERALPFLLFRSGEVPPKVEALGRVLPLAIMTTLVIYCVRNISFQAPGEYLPTLLAGALTAGLHLWKRNAFLSILGGTALYMLLVQLVF